MNNEKRFIVWFDSKEAEPSSVVGTKAANLMKLFRAGLPVPDGFCITVEAFKRCVEGPQAIPHEKMASFDMPTRLIEEILAAYSILMKKYGMATKVAVRSSALCEDLAHASFAGQYDTVLNVGSKGELISAISKSWASAFSDRAAMYGTNVGITSRSGQMAVIVQVMLNPDFAGVLFTRNPLAQDKEQMLVEFCRGLGDSVVAGTKVASQLRVRRDNLTITDISNPDAQLKVLMQDKIPWEMLFKMSLKIEEICRASQDIEWAYAGHAFWILQSRPITAEKRRLSRQIWSRANAGEILPGVVTPLTWSIIKPMLQAAGSHIGKSFLTLHWNWRHPYGEFADSPRLFNGRAYMELISVYPGFGRFPGVTPPLLEKVLGFEYHVCADEEIPQKTSRRHPMDIYRSLTFWLEMLNFTHTLASEAGRWMKRPLTENAKRPSGENTSPLVIVQEINELLGESSKILAWHIQCTSLVFSAFGLLEELVKKYLGKDELQRFGTGLTVDFHTISTVKQSISIWDLSEAVRKSSSMKKALFEAKTPGEFFYAISAGAGKGDFMKRWQAFLSEFGERSSQEFELAVAHWDEDCSFLLETMRTAIKEHAPDPRQRLAKQLDMGRQYINEIVALLKKRASAVDRWLFHRLITTYTGYVPLRENLKYCVVARFNRIRKRMLLLGRHMDKMKVITKADDIFFLSYEEITQVVRNGFTEADHLLSLIDARKEEHAQYQRSPLADLLIVSEGRMIPLNLNKHGSASVLHGIGCSVGQCTGRAYVVDSVLGEISVPPGHILVAPSIDPGLTPLFLTAAGLVTEIGGVLSHGAIVAREYGVPAVVGVQNATRLIKNGQMIAVDGVAGKVYLVESDQQTQG